ncbi:MAG TPA: hypothetical protein VHS53_02160, partial [Mucilaginibacter sp.]|nr:hypothetical protein [Mucilaginibacter sp.]
SGIASRYFLVLYVFIYIRKTPGLQRIGILHFRQDGSHTGKPLGEGVRILDWILETSRSKFAF